MPAHDQPTFAAFRRRGLAPDRDLAFRFELSCVVTYRDRTATPKSIIREEKKKISLRSDEIALIFAIVTRRSANSIYRTKKVIICIYERSMISDRCGHWSATAIVGDRIICSGLYSALIISNAAAAAATAARSTLYTLNYNDAITRAHMRRV